MSGDPEPVKEFEESEADQEPLRSYLVEHWS